jgi:hypothetical protein
MADADLLNELTANVRPVVDNFPSRISTKLVRGREYVELYDHLMDEQARIDRFRDSDLIARIWPESMRSASEPYFAYERLIKNYFIGPAYITPDDPYAWGVLDDLLTDTTLETLPLWLLGSDADNQRIVEKLVEEEGYRSEFALELARKHAAAREFDTALMYMEDYVTSTGNVPLWSSNFYLYLLARNGLTERASPVIAQMRAAGSPEMDRFVEWYSGRFPQATAGLAN